MRDVAALAGVGLRTVSRVMNSDPTVAPELAARVRDAAEKLSYRPNLTASSLRRGDGRSSTIGLLLEDVANPFSAALLRAVEDEMRQRGVQVLIGSLDQDPGRERKLARALIDRSVDGLLIVPTADDQSYLVAESRLGTVLVFLDREARLFAADTVVSDNRGGAIRAVEHLLDGGHRRIAYLGDLRKISTAQERFGGYRRALELAGVAIEPELIRHDLRTLDSATQAASQLMGLADPPTAIFASQNLITIGATRVLHASGLASQVALVGFDDFLLADILEPGITVITQDPSRLGALAAERLFARLDGDTSPPRREVVPIDLIARGSGELRAFDGEVSP
jgi:LacI family transcriptional regulator